MHACRYQAAAIQRMRLEFEGPKEFMAGCLAVSGFGEGWVSAKPPTAALDLFNLGVLRLNGLDISKGLQGG